MAGILSFKSHFKFQVFGIWNRDAEDYGLQRFCVHLSPSRALNDQREIPAFCLTLNLTFSIGKVDRACQGWARPGGPACRHETRITGMSLSLTRRSGRLDNRSRVGRNGPSGVPVVPRGWSFAGCGGWPRRPAGPSRGVVTFNLISRR